MSGANASNLNRASAMPLGRRCIEGPAVPRAKAAAATCALMLCWGASWAQEIPWHLGRVDGAQASPSAISHHLPRELRRSSIQGRTLNEELATASCGWPGHRLGHLGCGAIRGK